MELWRSGDKTVAVGPNGHSRPIAWHRIGRGTGRGVREEQTGAKGRQDAGEGSSTAPSKPDGTRWAMEAA